jgi:hypothetical protein
MATAGGVRAKRNMQVVLRLPTTPTVQGGWTTCARVRRLSMPIACLSSAMASASHGTGHGVAVGRGRSGNRLSCVGRFFRFRPLLSELELQQAFTHTGAIWSSVCVCSRLVTPRPDRDGRLLYMNLKRIERTASGKEKANMLWCELW